MTPFSTIRSVAAHLPEPNIDTDIIYPARYLLVLDRDGLGDYAFRDRRFEQDGRPKPDFVLNRPPFDQARVLVTGGGFGCGSSREQAVWTLIGLGIGCVIAPSFGEIFRNNALKNGLLPIDLPEAVCVDLGEKAEAGAIFTVDLESRALLVDGVLVAAIDLPEGQRQALLNGWDEIDLMLREEGGAIAAFEAGHRVAQPWLFLETR